MPMIDADGCPIHVAIDGRESGPTVILSNSLGTTIKMWEPQLAALADHFRVVRYDRRGHGKSGTHGPYSFERFGRDVIAILDALNIRTAHWCGLSMGGMVGQWLGANAADRFDRIVLANTTCHFADPSRFAGPHQGGDAERHGEHRRYGDRIVADGGFSRARAGHRAGDPAHVRCDAGRRLCRLLRGAEPARPARAAAEDRAAGADHRRPARHEHDGRAGRVHAQGNPEGRA